ncbi:MAG: type III pantothenate kinase [Dehalococcoidia bacterium]|nr:type III pantothenate kinase [Dehalococcoidia bacterium]
MLLAIGIGNTSIKLGIFDGETLRHTWHIATDRRKTADDYAVTLFNLLEHAGIKTADASQAAMWSSVPSLVSVFDELLRKHFHAVPLIIAAGIKTGIRVRMDNPREVGADRIANAVAAHALYKESVIIVDMGTATTFDVVSGRGEYLGGAIAPGLMIAAEALFTRPAQLYRVPLTAPDRAIGTNTVSAMQSGVIFGYTALVEGMVARLQGELPEKAKVVATGGYAPLILRETRVLEDCQPDLSLIGLRIVNALNRQG